jgi:hypothetical protein
MPNRAIDLRYLVTVAAIAVAYFAAVLRFMGGNQFDPTLVDVFVAMVDEYVASHGEGGDEAYRAAIEDSAILERQDNIKRLLTEAA